MPGPRVRLEQPQLRGRWSRWPWRVAREKAQREGVSFSPRCLLGADFVEEFLEFGPLSQRVEVRVLVRMRRLHRVLEEAGRLRPLEQLDGADGIGLRHLVAFGLRQLRVLPGRRRTKGEGAPQVIQGAPR